jgi:hypothetical protein
VGIDYDGMNNVFVNRQNIYRFSQICALFLSWLCNFVVSVTAYTIGKLLRFS